MGAKVRGCVRDPRLVCAVLAMVLRAAAAAASWRVNLIVHDARLDAAYYLQWAADIAGGDFAGTAGIVAGEPFLLNPLYAYLLAPVVAVFGQTTLAAIVPQVLLGGATAAITTEAARRYSGAVAGWCAGLAVAASASLVHLDSHVAVSGLAAFLIAGACLACAPAEPGADGAAAPDPGRRALMAGLWLGLGALARPVAMLALPFVAWLVARDSRPRWRAPAVLVAVFGAFALLSFARNTWVSGEPAVFTAANGHNLYLGNNPVARRTHSMLTHDFRFSPRDMHLDSKLRVAAALGREPTRVEVANWYRDAALRELSNHPLDSLEHYANKARWFFSAAEVPSSADLVAEWRVAGVPRWAFVPTWLLAALGLAGVAVAWRQRELLLGPGALALAHFAACTAAFPLSHYRSPAVPALAVLAGAAVSAALPRRRGGAGRWLPVLLVAAGAAGIGMLPPQPDPLPTMRHYNDALMHVMARRYEPARTELLAALELDQEFPGTYLLLIRMAREEGRMDVATDVCAELVRRHPWNPLYRADLAELHWHAGAREDAVREMDALIDAFPWCGALHTTRGVLVLWNGDAVRAAADFRRALELGHVPPLAALDETGVPRPSEDGR